MHIYSALMGQSTGTTAFNELRNTLPTHCRHIEHMHEDVWFKNIIDKRTATLYQHLDINFSSLYLYVNGSGSITSVGEERANLSGVIYL